MPIFRCWLPASVAMAILMLLVLAVMLVAAPVSSASAQVIPGDPGNFITILQTDNVGTSDDDQITIPGTGTGYNYDIYWEGVGNPANSGSVAGITTSSHTITFPAASTYQVEISGDFPQIYFDYQGDRENILSVEQWGNIAWNSMERAFSGPSNLHRFWGRETCITKWVRWSGNSLY